MYINECPRCRSRDLSEYRRVDEFLEYMGISVPHFIYFIYCLECGWTNENER